MMAEMQRQLRKMLRDDRSADYQWLAQHEDEFLGQWVAVAGGGLVAVAPTLRDLQQRLHALSLMKPPLVHRCGP